MWQQFFQQMYQELNSEATECNAYLTWGKTKLSGSKKQQTPHHTEVKNMKAREWEAHLRVLESEKGKILAWVAAY